MNEEVKELMTDLLARRATVGLEADEKQQLDKLFAHTGVADNCSFELAAAAIGLVDLAVDEPMPAHLHARIIASADEYFSAPPLSDANEADKRSNSGSEADEYQKILTLEPRRRSWNWLGWAVAAIACIALAVNVWFTRINLPEISETGKTPPATPEKLTPEQEFAALVASQPNIVKATWGAGNMKDLKDVGGDVVWSDEKQKGFMRLRGLPVNDKNKEQYQLWIFDKNQDPKKPIDGGVFDIPANGEIVIPIDAKLTALGPNMFAITVEKPGGVVVSDRQKIAALAKVETPAG